MKAIVIDKTGEAGSVREMPREEPHGREVLVRVTAVGVNPVDWKIRDGMGGMKPKMPLTLGQDFAGTVEEAGDGAAGFREGERIFGIARTHGAYAQYTVAKLGSQAEPVGKIPEGVTDEQAAALPTPGLTAYAALERLHVGKGTTLLIHGAAGAVGAIAVQLAHQRGAHVDGTSRGATADIKELGADETIDTGARDPIDAVKAAHPNGIDAVLDLVSSEKDTAMTFADVLKPGGAIVSTNHVLDVDALRKRGFDAENITMNETPQSSREGLEYLAGLVADGKLIVRIARDVPLTEAAHVLDQSKAGQMPGKTVLKPA